jgi:non-heme chloroperoxidase
MPFVQASDRARLFYAEWGAGRPVVFANGNGMPGDMWNYQRDDLAAAGFRCITYDRRGHGRSDRPASDYAMDTLADDLASLIEGTGVAGAVLVGHSVGAAEVVRYLTRHGSARVSGIVLSAPTTPSVLKSGDSPGGLDPESLEASWGLLRRDAGTWLAALTNQALELRCHSSTTTASPARQTAPPAPGRRPQREPLAGREPLGRRHRGSQAWPWGFRLT